jgi:hypothetical protein
MCDLDKLNPVGEKNIKLKIYVYVLLSVVLYGWETWFLTLSEKHRLQIFDDKRQGSG